jgi:3-oxoadipate enol-lactonase
MRARLFHKIEGTGPAIVLLHPVGLDHSFWGEFASKAAETHMVVAVDLCGHGQSDPAKPGRGIGAYADDVIGLLDELGLSSTSLLGLSFGGMIAQEVALRNPARISTLVVGACAGRIPPEAREAVRGRGQTDPETGMASVVDTTVARWFTLAFIDTPAVTRVRERLLVNDPQGWAAGWDAIAGFDAQERLGTLMARTLVIAGELDAGTPVAATKAMADAIPGAEFTMLAGAPHMMQIECADRFAERTLAFLQGAAS